MILTHVLNHLPKKALIQLCCVNVKQVKSVCLLLFKFYKYCPRGVRYHVLAIDRDQLIILYHYNIYPIYCVDFLLSEIIIIISHRAIQSVKDVRLCVHQCKTTVNFNV